jgi:peptidoglycan/LPS O-acetylase OafA/YrhL
MIDHALPYKVIPGGFAVSIFFFISGFLITRLLLDEHALSGSIDLTRFYLSRAFRLFPALIVALAYALLVTYLLGYQQSWLAAAGVLFYFANYIHAIDNTVLRTIAMDPAWSLSVEEHFYLIYPALMIWGLRKPARCFQIVIGAIAAAIILRFVYALTIGDHASKYIFAATETRMDFIAYGCLAALICNSKRGKTFVELVGRSVVFWTAVAMVVLSLAIRDNIFRDTGRYYLQGIALFVIVPATIFAPSLSWLRRPLNLPIVNWIGLISYSLYLFHFASFYIGEAIGTHLYGHGLLALTVGTTIGFTISFTLASASYYWIEQPFLKLRGRLLPRKSSVDKPAHYRLLATDL